LAAHSAAPPPFWTVASSGSAPSSISDRRLSDDEIRTTRARRAVAPRGHRVRSAGHDRHPRGDDSRCKGGVLRDTAIVVQGSKIPRIDPKAVGGVTYDLKTVTVMPGWIDTHAHIANRFDRGTGRLHSNQSASETKEEQTMYLVENAYNILMSGFTTVQSPGAEIDKYLRAWTAENKVPGPAS